MLVASLCAWLLLSPAHAEPPPDPEPEPLFGEWIREIRGGVLAHDVGGLWSGFSRETGVDYNAEVLFWRSGLGPDWGTFHPNLGFSINDRGGANKLYAGVIWDLRTPFGLFFNIGVGGAVHNGDIDQGSKGRKQLGSRFLFRIPIEIGWEFFRHHRIMVTFDHISNASLGDPNQGLDTLGARYGYRF